MPKAVWNGETIAESKETIVVEGTHYFPRNTIREKCFLESPTTTDCPWKGTANYYHIEVDGQTNADAAWYYAEPKSEVSHIQNHIAFWKGVEVR
ncbi:MAG: DUF427 domain-containing protein [Pirellulaceae bacterium]|nr:DUF427 domain-containing protein [Pirellulaceae bacterium]